MDAKPHRSELHRLSEIIYFSRQLGHILRKNGVNPSLSSFLDIIRRLGFSFETPQQTPSVLKVENSIAANTCNRTCGIETITNDYRAYRKRRRRGGKGKSRNDVTQHSLHS